MLRHRLFPLHNVHLHIPRQEQLLRLAITSDCVELRTTHQVVLHRNRCVRRGHNRLVIADARGPVIVDRAGARRYHGLRRIYTIFGL